MHENSMLPIGEGRVRLLAVVVFYRTVTEQSTAFRTLGENLHRLGSLADSVRVLLYDNTPQESAIGNLPAGFRYEAAPCNGGLARAYNRGLCIARDQRFNWLLTLDQDTTLPEDFLARMLAAASRMHKDKSVGAIVPQLAASGRILSPNYVGVFRNKPVPEGYCGFNQREMYALNSAALLRVSAIEEIGGFSEDFWLDQLDLWVHHKLHRAGKRTFISGDIRVEHRLSLQNYEGMSLPRFRNFIEAESAFFDLYKSPLENLALTATLLFRYGKRLLRGGNPLITAEIRKALENRVFHARRARLSQWKSACEERKQRESRSLPADLRPPISVCMAAHNGARFIGLQVQSILAQLGPADEIVIADDASTDDTCRILEAFQDLRIKVLRQRINRGVLRTFESAIAEARGDILFLADQDDLWTPGKVAAVLKAFREHPEVTVVVSDAALIDTRGDSLGMSYYTQRGRFRSGAVSNILRCKYLGCTMAFRGFVRATVLPFPENADVLHDLWIGAANTLMGGQTYYIDQQLVQYRRHENNATGNRRLSLTRQMRIRWDLCRSLAALWWQRRRTPARELPSIAGGPSSRRRN